MNQAEYYDRMKTLGERIKEARTEKGITIRSLVSMLQDYGDQSAAVKRDTLMALENGRVETIRIQLKTLYAIGDILGLDINYLIGEQGHKSLDRNDIAEYTFLQESAVEELHRTGTIGDWRVAYFLNHFILNSPLGSIGYYYDKFLIAKREYEDSKCTATEKDIEKRNQSNILYQQLKEAKQAFLAEIEIFLDYAENNLMDFDAAVSTLKEEGEDNGKEET